MRVTARRLTRDDLPWAWSISLVGAGDYLGLQSGRILSLDSFGQRLDGGFAHWKLIATATDAYLGYVSFYDFDPMNRHVKVVYMGDIEAPPAVGGMGVALSIELAFRTLPIDRVLGEIPGPNWERMSSSFEVFGTLDGVLESHLESGGQYYDLVFASCTRSDWATTSSWLATWLSIDGEPMD